MDISVKNKLDRFFENQTEHKYEAREILIRADEEPSGVFYLVDGIVRMYAVSSQGEEVVINLYQPVSFFPMAWVLNNSTSHYYFETLTQVTARKAARDEFLRFIKSEPEILLELLKRIYRGLDGYFSRMEYLMSGSAQARLITEILIYAKRFGVKKESGVEVEIKLTEKDLAAQTGVARETVSREIHKLKAKGFIKFDKNILTIKDLPGLEEELLSL